MTTIASEFSRLCTTASDIWEHLPTLERYALECNHITECGVRSAVSSYAFANGLRRNPNAKLIQVDIDGSHGIRTFQSLASKEGLNTVFYQMSDLDCPMENTDLLFIDTWHVYGHMKRELERWNSYVGKYMILHDTEVDRWVGETIRNGWDGEEQSRKSGIPVHEIMRGIWPAVLEFLESHPEWKIHEHFSNCNGLTVLKRKE
jgi:cephalosporin hydroxylase